MRKNYHREALAILERQDSMNAEAMLWWIARSYPYVFTSAARATATKGPDNEAIDTRVMEHIKAGNTMNAIKRYREITPDMTLAGAKDYCDNLKALLAP